MILCKKILLPIILGCLIIVQPIQSKTKYNFYKALPGKWHAFNTKCLITYTFKRDLTFTFYNVCDSSNNGIGRVSTFFKDGFLLKHNNNKQYRAYLKGPYFSIKYNKHIRYDFERRKSF